MASPLPNPQQATPMVTQAGTLSPSWSQWFVKLAQLVNGTSGGISVTITTAKLTTGGTEGSMTFKNGVLTSQTAAT